MLEGLQTLLNQFSAGSGTNPAVGGSAHADESQPSAGVQSEDGLFLALQRIVQRAQRQPGTLLQRLVSLGDAAKRGHGFGKRKLPPDPPPTGQGYTTQSESLPPKRPRAQAPAEPQGEGKGKGKGQKGGKTG